MAKAKCANCGKEINAEESSNWILYCGDCGKEALDKMKKEMGYIQGSEVKRDRPDGDN